MHAAKYPPRCRFSEPPGPLAFSADNRGRSKALFFAVLNGTDQSDFCATQRTGDRKRYHLRSHQLFRSCCNLTAARLASCMRGARFCDALGDDSSFFAVTHQQWRACVRRMLRCKLAFVLPSSSLDPRLAAQAFAVAEDENRDKFIGDRRCLNSSERSIGRAHLPY